jgi:two-component system cell cycle response regulator DivK
MRILLAEDSGFMRVALERLLVKAGHKVATVSDGQQAVQAVTDNAPELIVLDMMLPKLSGLEVLEALKGNSVTKHIPVIVLTSLSQKNESKLLQAGAAAYLTKSDKLLEENSILLGLVRTLGLNAKSATSAG